MLHIPQSRSRRQGNLEWKQLGALQTKLVNEIEPYRDTYKKVGMFDENVNHSEDYLLSKQYPVDKFKISNHYVGQDDRRFKKMGYMFMVTLLIKGFINKDNIDYFKKDVGYW